MAQKPVNTQKQRTYWGSALLVAGLLAFLLNLVSAATSTLHLVAGFKTGTAGLLTSLGLSLLHAAGSIALDQMDYGSVLAHILVLFFAMVAILFGFALARSRASKNAPDPVSSSALHNNQEAQ